jgi:hypothetical protein
MRRWGAGHPKFGAPAQKRGNSVHAKIDIHNWRPGFQRRHGAGVAGFRLGRRRCVQSARQHSHFRPVQQSGDRGEQEGQDRLVLRVGADRFQFEFRPGRQRRRARGQRYADGGHGNSGRCRSQLQPGCADNRVMLVNSKGKIIWQYGQFGVTGRVPTNSTRPCRRPTPNTRPSTSQQSRDRDRRKPEPFGTVW